MRTLMATVLLLFATPALFADAGPIVRTMRVPGGGIQPQAVAQGETVHLIYFAGEAKAGDVHYARSTDGGRTFGPSIRVNSEPASAIAAGTVRGPQLAVGKGGRAHVAWMGSHRATPKAPGNGAPMLYARLNDRGDAFEPQRNVIAAHPGLDGGGSVAADGAGNVYVVWHAPQKPGSHEEADRCVWVARSADDGKTFAPERRANEAATGVCACCGLQAFTDDRGGLYVLYRGARERVHRDIHLLHAIAGDAPFRSTLLDRLDIGICVMSTAAMAQMSKAVIAAWEGRGEVYLGALGKTGLGAPPVAPPGEGKNRKHPRLAVNARGQILMAWAEGTAWNKGGTIAWRVFDEQLRPIEAAAGGADGLPPWGSVAAFAAPDGGFTIIY